jgi:hypothetical protein
MAAIGNLRHRLVRMLRSESGMAVPTALMALIASFALASAAVLASVDVQQGSKRDRNSKSAIAAADAGASVALLRLNRYQDTLMDGEECVGPAGEVLTPSEGWCPPTPQTGVGSSTYSYQLSAYTGGEVNVIASGTAGGVTRRVEVGLVSVDGKNVFADERLIGKDNITMEGTPDIRTDVGTNGSVEQKGSGTICGDIRHGVGQSGPEPDCDGELLEEDKNLPEVAVPTEFPSNCRLSATCEDPSEVDTYSKQRTSKAPWEDPPGYINVGSNSTLTMGGSDYLVCGLFVGPGNLIMAAKSQVRIFVDTPENCGLAPGALQVVFDGNANITSTGYNPSEGSFAVPNIYLLGNGGVKLTGNSGTNELILYAPYSEVEMGGNATWIGMIAGKTLRLHGTPRIESDPGMAPPEIRMQSLWQRTHYVECAGPSETPPDRYC